MCLMFSLDFPIETNSINDEFLIENLVIRLVFVDFLEERELGIVHPKHVICV